MDIQNLIDNYARWIKSEITFTKVGEYYEITTPYLDSANDYLQIYVRQKGDEVFFTDDGYIIQSLKMAGVKLNKSKNEQINRLLNQYGVQREGDDLVAKANIHDFGKKKHLFIQALMRADDMFISSKSRISSIFLDDIQGFLDEEEIFYSDNVQFTGTSGFSHNYDFLLQRSKSKPERLCQAVNSPNKSNMSNILFAWNDTKPVRRKESQLIVFLNDENSITRGVEDAFQNYDAQVIRWSQRNSPQNLNLLSA